MVIGNIYTWVIANNYRQKQAMKQELVEVNKNNFENHEQEENASHHPGRVLSPRIVRNPRDLELIEEGPRWEERGRGFEPGVNRGFEPRVNRGFEPGVNKGFEPRVNDGLELPPLNRLDDRDQYWK
ncbi:uncharacterized protein LOC111703907 [Eurytemora carolleeae]|uniref:uncharacterized protein LOC111703907 n=1 Tax=Eurytemora carolleeae TaxID=1294199 RepID=UPI000C75745B|nr:uncharacterized protein LOC111703907 [Eurytemora carolleeae]|eukprot:XP_023331761.1 uncharacterized protein LOC111703907 [Eurytemora affinis]